MDNVSVGSRILIAIENGGLVSRINPLLESEGYAIERVETGTGAIERVARELFGCLVLDLCVPGGHAFDVCRQVRSAGESVPVFLLAPAKRHADCVTALRLGADDFVVEPIDGAEFLARVEAVVRRGRRPPFESAYRSRTIKVDFATAEVRCHGRVVRLSALELKVLRYFIRHRGEVVSRDQLLNAVWGYDATPVTRTVDVRVAALRRKLLHADTPAIETVHGLGYKFIA